MNQSAILPIFIFFTFFFLQNIPCRADITTGLVGWWKLTDGSGSSVADSSGNGSTGTLKNGPSWVGGKVWPYALSFTAASSQYVDLGNSATIKPSLPVTISVWVNVSSLAGSWFFDNDDQQATNYSGVELGLVSTGQIAIEYGNNLGGDSPSFRQSFLTTATITPGRWYHIVGVAINATTMNVYIDCVSKSGALSGTGSMLGYSTATAKIGANLESSAVDPTNAIYFNGIIDDVRIYNRALSASDVAQLFAAHTRSLNQVHLSNFHTNYY